MVKRKVLIIVAVLAVILLCFAGRDYLTLEFLKEHREELRNYISENPIYASLIYFIVYVVTTAVSFPGASLLTLAGGALFGLWWGTVLVSFASTLGATLAFLSARFLLRDWVQARFSDRLITLNAGIKREGAFYLFSLRLAPMFPFFLVNLLMGLTPMHVWTYFFVSQLGMLPGTLVYVNAGTQLANINSLQGILTPDLLFSFILLGVFPLLAKKSVDWFKKRL